MLQRWSALGVLARLLAVTGSGCTFVGDLGQDSMSAGGSAGGSDDGVGEGGDATGGDVDTTLPMLPPLTNVRVRIVGDAANITFDAVDAAVDYRVYALPPDDAIHVGGDGVIVIDDGLYRCAGQREALYMLEDIVSPDEGWNDVAAGGATLVERQVVGFTRTEADAELGHVYLTQAADRLPVYALADPDVEDDGAVACGRPTFAASRAHRYTTDAAVRDALVAQRWRDDGIAFWVPMTAGAATRPIYEASLVDDALLRWIDGPEAAARGPGTTILQVLREPEPGTVPLMRVHVQPYCGRAHDELVAGLAGFRRVRRQGDQPLPALRWSGLTGPITLVAEALDQGCPYQGILSPQGEPAFVDEGAPHEAYVTLAQMRAASPSGEVFVNGQYDDPPAARAIRRSFITVAPSLPTMDVYATFPEDEDFFAGFAAPTGSVYGLHFDAPMYLMSSYSNSHIHFGSMLGEFWLAYNDIAAGVNGMVRLGLDAPARVDAGSYLHVTGEFGALTTDRRFPQLFISDQPAPLQDNLASGTTVIVGPRRYAPSFIDLQICDHMTWDLGYECAGLPTFAADVAPQVAPVADAVGSDNAVQLDVYLSPSRIYLLLDGKPYACTDLPALADDGVVHGPPVGDVRIAWGDVLAHSAIDFTLGGGPLTVPDSYGFHRRHLPITTQRHFDNLGVSSGVAAPPWDEVQVPCSGGP